jgi:hypothetical protein
MEEQRPELPSHLQPEHEPSHPPTVDQGNAHKFREPRGWAAHWCGFALSSADRATEEGADEER